MQSVCGHYRTEFFMTHPVFVDVFKVIAMMLWIRYSQSTMMHYVMISASKGWDE